MIQELRRIAPTADNGTLRGFLAKFLFVGEDVFKPVSALSGGEKGRLALAKLIYSQKNVLILDEPTNHLDIPSRESLENALEEYDGTIIAVSHDRFFLDKIANQMLSFENNGTVLNYDGNYTEFHDWKQSEPPAIAGGLTSQSAPGTQATRLPVEAPRHGSASATNLSKNQINQLEKRIKQIESEIPTLESEAEKLTAQMTDPKIASDYARLAEVTEKVSDTESRIKSLYSEWEDALAQLA